MTIKESGENYLETILILQKRQGVVRAVDVVEELGYTKSSVSRAVNILKQEGFIEVSKNGLITFTEKGVSYSNEVYERHKVLKDFLVSIGVSEEIAESDACRIEHVLSDETFQAIKKKLKKT